MAMRTLAYRAATSEKALRLLEGSDTLRERLRTILADYVAGATADDAARVADSLVDAGFMVTIDRFAESATPQAARDAVVACRELATKLADRGDDVWIEVNPSSLAIDDSVDNFCSGIAAIADELGPGQRIRLSAEESWRTPAIMAATLALAHDGVPIAATLQANLLRTPDDVAPLVDADVPIRLVKGAFLERDEVAHDWGEPTDLAYARLALAVRDAGGTLALASHDASLVAALLGAVPDATVEVLLGVRSEWAQDLVTNGHAVRVYAPYGQNWLQYGLRRKVEALRSQ